jgi:hypothetical protein
MAKAGSTCQMLHPGFLLSLFFDPEDGGNMILQNVGWLAGRHYIPEDRTLYKYRFQAYLNKYFSLK